MAEKRQKKFIYNDIDERYKRMNKIYIICISYIWVLLAAYLLLRLRSESILPIIAYANITLIVIFALGNFFIYFRKKNSRLFKIVTLVEIGIEIFLIGGQTSTQFIYFIMVAMLALQIPYYEKKSFKWASFSYIILYTVLIVVRSAKGAVELNLDSVCGYICIYQLLFVVNMVGSIAREYSEHALGSVEEQSGIQKKMVDGIIDVSKTVQGEAVKSSDMVDALVQVTESVVTSMERIVAATNTTALSIEEQNSMTQTIQRAIGETSERSKKMVSIAVTSNESIQENIKVMNELKEQSKLIAATNQEVTAAMDRLQDKTKEVEEIAGMILKISAQTNLLALNASIESARAGEAGKGFAVVAEQIRQLAEQSKSSTEDITRITNELSGNADEVVKSVEESIDAAVSQNDMILSAAESFEKLNTNMVELISDINEIDRKICGLSESNDRIVENISQLSATTQEVTASAEQAHEMSQQNLNSAEQVKVAINMIGDTTDGMKKYL